MAEAQDVLDQILPTIWEDNGLVLGLLTVQQFIDFLNLTLTDYQKRTGLYLQFFTQTVLEGQLTYPVPDPIMRVDDAFVGGELMEPAPFDYVQNYQAPYAYEYGPPRWWNQEQIPNRTMQLLPVSNYNSSGIPGATDPNGGQYGLPVLTDQDQNPTTMASSGALTILGPSLPATIVELTDPIPLLADDFTLSIIAHGVMQRIFSSDCELYDPAHAEFFGQLYEEGVALGAMIASEPLDR